MVGSIWAFAGILVGALIIGDSVAPAHRSLIKISGTDSVAYYATTHSLFFDGDFDLTNQYQHLPRDISRYTAIRPETGLPGSPFAIGFSILEIPFLAMGHVYTLLTVGNSTGYSKGAMTAFLVGIIFYLAVGLSALFFLLRSIGRYLDVPAQWTNLSSWIVCFAIWPATTLAYYTFSPMAHVAAFAACSVFLLVWWHARDTLSMLRWTLCGAAAGMLTLVRWEAALFLTVPFVYDVARLTERADGMNSLRNPFWWLTRSLMMLTFIATIFPQSLQWREIYGSMMTIPQGPGFFADVPGRYMAQVLLSSRNGWFVWNPITLFGSLGLIYGLRYTRALCLSLLVVLVLYIGVIGSQPSNWHGATSFGHRLLTTCVPLVGIGIALLLFRGSRRLRHMTLTIAILCSIYTFLFAVQYRLDLVPKGDRLTVGELVVDKVFFAATWSRGNAYRAARVQLDNSRPQEAIDIIVTANKKFGEDRRLLLLLAEAYGVKGDLHEEAIAEGRLRKLLASRLW